MKAEVEKLNCDSNITTDSLKEEKTIHEDENDKSVDEFYRKLQEETF